MRQSVTRNPREGGRALQNLAVLLEEVGSLCAAFGTDRILVIPSLDKWNPVAAVEIKDFDLPARLFPPRVDLRIPIPNLYAFCSSASVVIVNRAIVDLDAENSRTESCVLGLREITPESITSNLQYFADLRENRSGLLGMFYLYVIPPWVSGRFVHRTLLELCEEVSLRVQDASAAYEDDIKYCTKVWQSTGNPWWLLRIAQLHYEAGNEDEARRVALDGKDRYRFREDFDLFLQVIR